MHTRLSLRRLGLTAWSYPGRFGGALATVCRRATSATRPPLALTDLTKRVNALVGHRDAAAAVEAVRAALPQLAAAPEQFPWPALSAALFACADAGQLGEGLALVAEVRRMLPQVQWRDESVLSVTLRLQCAAGDDAGARQMFTYLAQSGLLRQRTASTYLRCLCSDTHSAGRDARDFVFAVYAEGKRRGVEFAHDDYLAIGCFCVRHGEPARTLAFLLRDMQPHVETVSESFKQEVLIPWTGAAAVRPFTLPAPPSPAAEDASASAGQPAPARVSCPVCGGAIGGYPFSADDRARLLADLTQSVIPKRCRTHRAQLGFRAWQRYVAQRCASGGIDLLVDGANLGYYGLSSWYEPAKRALLRRRGVPEAKITARDVDFDANCKKSGGGVDIGVNFELIDLALRQAVDPRNGFQRPLVLLHERHCEPHNLTAESAALLRQWRAKQWVYCTPSGLNDDLCWLYAALELTAPAETDAAAAGRPSAHSPRERAVHVLTNDLMRDHHFTLLSPRCFSRWRQQHQLSFRCSWVNRTTQLHFVWPPAHTRCVQYSPPKSGLTDSAAACWHLPLHAEAAAALPAMEKSEPWLCLRL